jgi:hypothetical protein
LIGFRRLNSKGNQGVFSTILHKKDVDDFSPTSKSIEPNFIKADQYKKHIGRLLLQLLEPKRLLAQPLYI